MERMVGAQGSALGRQNQTEWKNILFTDGPFTISCLSFCQYQPCFDECKGQQLPQTRRVLHIREETLHGGGGGRGSRGLHTPSRAPRESLKMSQLLSPGGCWLQVTTSNGMSALWPLSSAVSARWEGECVCICISPVLLGTTVLGCDASCVLNLNKFT